LKQVYFGAEDGSTLLTRDWDLSEIPTFIKAGAIIPESEIEGDEVIGRASRQYKKLTFNVYQHSSLSNSFCSVYEDDGETTAYHDVKEFAYTFFNYTKVERTQLVINMSIFTLGYYPSQVSTRAYTIKIFNTLPPTILRADNQDIKYSRFGGPNSWYYDANELAVVIELKEQSTKKTVNIEFIAPRLTISTGIVGQFKHVTLAKRLLDQSRTTPGENSINGGFLSDAASIPDVLSFFAGSVSRESILNYLIDYQTTTFVKALNEIRNMKTSESNEKRWLSALALLESVA